MLRKECSTQVHVGRSFRRMQHICQLLSSSKGWSSPIDAVQSFIEISAIADIDLILRESPNIIFDVCNSNNSIMCLGSREGSVVEVAEGCLFFHLPQV